MESILDDAIDGCVDVVDNIYKVLAKVNDKGQVDNIYSTCFKEACPDDILIKEGDGDEFIHVGYYIVTDTNGCHNYKILDGMMVETTEDEKQLELSQITHQETLPSEMDILKQENKLLKAQVQALTETSDFHEELIAEIATVLYA